MSKATKLISLRLAEQDKKYLEDIAKIMNINKPLFFLKKRSFIGYTTQKTYIGQNNYGLEITNKRIYEDLYTIGVRPSKSYMDLSMPIIDPSLVRYFILGLFEGDGSLSLHNKDGKMHSVTFTIACQQQMAHDIHQVLIQEGFSAKMYKRKSIHIVSIASRKEIEKLYNYLYADSSLYMER